MLRDAALLQLELLRAALDEGMTLKDSTPFNVQWVGARPVFIDIGSFTVADPAEPWTGYRQFCEMFLYPLFLQAYKDVPFHPWLRGSLEGVAARHCNNLMSARDRLRPGVFTHVYLLSIYRKFKNWVYPGFPTPFWGLSGFFVGDLIGKALWELVENAQRFPRHGGRVLCVHGAVSFHRARPCATRWLPGRGPMRDVELDRCVLGLQSTGEQLCSRQHRRPVHAERSTYPGKTGISGATLFGKVQKLISRRALRPGSGIVGQASDLAQPQAAAIKRAGCAGRARVQGGRSHLCWLTSRGPRGGFLAGGQQISLSRAKTRLLHGEGWLCRWHAASPAHPPAVPVHQRVDAKAFFCIDVAHRSRLGFPSRSCPRSANTASCV